MDGSQRERQELGGLIHQVRGRIWSWDPLGVARLGAPEDEYDCLVDIAVGELRRGASRDAIASRLVQELTVHFGIGPTGEEQTVADDLVAWRGDLRLR